MGWTDKTWAFQEGVESSEMNQLRDNFRILGRRQIHAGTTDMEIWHPCVALMTSPTFTTTNPAGGTMVAIPFFPRLGTVDRIAFEVTSALSGNGRAGLYLPKSSTNAYPGSLLVDGGEFSVSSIGVKAATVDTPITDGLLWAVYTQSAAAGIRALLRANVAPLLGMASTMGTTWRSTLTVTFTYGALPSTFPASATFDPASDLAIITVRYSA